MFMMMMMMMMMMVVVVVVMMMMMMMMMMMICHRGTIFVTSDIVISVLSVLNSPSFLVLFYFMFF